VQFRLLADPLQGLQPSGQQDRIGFIDRRDGKRSQDIIVIVDDGDDFVALLVFVTRVANAVAAFFGHGVGAMPCRIRRSS
jgi:hypothetical protein